MRIELYSFIQKSAELAIREVFLCLMIELKEQTAVVIDWIPKLFFL